MKTILYTIGIDPSINSTGLCIQRYVNDKLDKEYFYIIKGDKLTKRENKFTTETNNFDYILYDKLPITGITDNHELELCKTKSFFSLCNSLCDTIKLHLKEKNAIIKCVIEGISYGSTIRTRSVFDLAGLNYMIRKCIYDKFINNKSDFRIFICTPTEIKKHITGNGNANKEQMVNAFTILRPDINPPKIDDISDAFFMSNYAKIL